MAKGRGGNPPPNEPTTSSRLAHSLEDDYLRLRKLQKLAREEMWHLFSHHPELEAEWIKTHPGWGECMGPLKALIEWEPE